MRVLTRILVAALPALMPATLWAAQPYTDSTIPGVTTPNAHTVAVDADGKPMVMRGRTPTTPELAQLKAVGMTDILIFKNELHGENKTEAEALKDIGFTDAQIHQIAMPWKDLPDFKTSCLMTIDALQQIEATTKAGGKIFFHCTAGEDRTGYLAGLYRILHDRLSPLDAFTNEMCAFGYEHGNHGKPFKSVVLPIRVGLTPLYITIAKRLAVSGLNDSICDTAPETIDDGERQQFLCK
jgi:protein-tyrosine phosphatase